MFEGPSSIHVLRSSRSEFIMMSEAKFFPFDDLMFWVNDVIINKSIINIFRETPFKEEF